MAIDHNLKREGVPQVTVIHDGKRGVADLSKSFGLVVIYSNSRLLKCIPNHLDLEGHPMHYYLSTPDHDKRDAAMSSVRAGAYFQRKWWGFSQNMPFCLGAIDNLS